MAKRKKTSTTTAAPVQTPCTQCPLRKLATFRDFTAEELEFMRTFKSGELGLEQVGLSPWRLFGFGLLMAGTIVVVAAK